MIRYIYLCFFTILSIASHSCKNSKETPIPHVPLKARSVLVYVSANNSLIDFAYDNINEMEAGFNVDVDGDLIVYAKLSNETPCIYKISKDQSKEIKSEKLKQYNPHNSSDPEVMKSVIEDMKSLSPAESYGLILWSHATAWIPSNYTGVKLRSFGDDNGSDTDLLDLEKVIPEKLDFLMFDACSMASIEVLYQLQKKAKYIIASPAEVLGRGMPYREIVNDLFIKKESALIGIAEKYYNYYNNQPYPYQSGTITIVKTDELKELALQTKLLLSGQKSMHEDYNRDKLQRMDLDPANSRQTVFDFSDFIFQNYTEENYKEWQKQFDKTVLYTKNTDTFTDSWLVTRDIRINGGIATYIPHPDNEELVHPYYKRLKWYQDSGYEHLF